MPTVTLSELRKRYESYRESVMYLAQNGTSVLARKEALWRRDDFERDVRDGILDGLFDESQNWG